MSRDRFGRPPRRPWSLSDEQREAMVAMRQTGATYALVGRTFGISDVAASATIRNRIAGRLRGGRPNTAEDFWDRVEPEPNTGCWIWVGYRLKSGYGNFAFHGTIPAHRFAYQLLRGPIPEGLTLDHYICNFPPCVNPWHTEPVPLSVNIARAKARRTGCRRGGHPYDKVWQSATNPKDRRRFCSVCDRENKRASVRRLRLQKQSATA